MGAGGRRSRQDAGQFAAPSVSREVADLLDQLAIALERGRGPRQNVPQPSDNRIVEAGSGSSTTEEPMYKWVAKRPEPHWKKFRVAVMTIEGKQERHAF